MSITIVHPNVENLQSFSEFFDLEKLLQSKGVLPWLLANSWNYDDESCLIANIIDESTSLVKFGTLKSLILRLCLMN